MPARDPRYPPQPPAPPRATTGGPPGYYGLATVLGAALVVRLLYVLAAEVHLEDGFDMTWYRIAGHRLADGDGYTLMDGSPTAFWPPGYAALIGLVTALFGRNFFWVQLVQVGIGVLTCWLTYELAAAWLGRRRALLAAAMLALLPDTIAFTPLALSETLFGLLFVLSVLMFSRLATRQVDPPTRAWVALGAITAAASLVRAVAFPLPAVYFVASLWSGAGAAVSLRRLLLITLGLLACIAPWALRNHLVMGAPVLLGTQAGEVFMIAHGPYATGGHSLIRATPEEHRRHGEQIRSYVLDFSRVPPPQREIASMKAEVARAVQYATSHPLEELRLIPRRLFFLFAHGHKALDWGRRQLPDGTRTPLLGATLDRAYKVVADLTYYGLLVLALAGVPAALHERDPTPRAILLTIAGVCALHGIVLFGDPRFHQPLLPLFAVLAAVPLESILDRIVAGRHGAG